MESNFPFQACAQPVASKGNPMKQYHFALKTFVEGLPERPTPALQKWPIVQMWCQCGLLEVSRADEEVWHGKQAHSIPRCWTDAARKRGR